MENQLTQTSNYKKVLQLIFKWPANERFALVQEVLKTLAPTGGTSPHPLRARRSTLAVARGLLATNHPAPSDTEIDQWLDDHRMEKYS